MKLNEMKLQKKSGVIKMIKLHTNLKGRLFGMFRFLYNRALFGVGVIYNDPCNTTMPWNFGWLIR